MCFCNYITYYIVIKFHPFVNTSCAQNQVQRTVPRDKRFDGFLRSCVGNASGVDAEVRCTMSVFQMRLPQDTFFTDCERLPFGVQFVAMSIRESPPMNFTCVIIQLIVLVSIALHLMAGILPEEAAWSVWPYTALPGPVAWLGGLAVASLALRPVNDAVGRGVHRLRVALSNRVHAGAAAKDNRFWFALIALSMAIPFWLFRIRHLLWGDAYFIVKALSYTGPDRPIWTVYNWQSPLSIFIHAQLWSVVNPVSDVGVETLYAITSVLSGIGFVYVLFLLADSMGRDWPEKATIFGLVITTGSVQLFFGYIENYTVISLGLILTLYLGTRCLQEEISLVWPSLALAVTNAFHPSTIVLWPALGYVGWRVASRRSSAREKASEWARLVLPPILVFAGLAALMTTGGHGPGAMLVDDRPGGADGIPFVPLFRVTTEWQHYTMFSLAHLQDWANEHFLISPFGLPLLLLALVNGLISRWKSGRLSGEDDPSDNRLYRMRGDSGVTAFLTIASLAYLVLTFVWNPDYGGRRDWDLFAPSAFVYTLLAAYLLTRQLGDRPGAVGDGCSLARVARLLIAASALYTAAWIYYNTIPWPYPG